MDRKVSAVTLLNKGQADNYEGDYKHEVENHKNDAWCKACTGLQFMERHDMWHHNDKKLKIGEKIRHISHLEMIFE